MPDLLADISDVVERRSRSDVGLIRLAGPQMCVEVYKAVLAVRNIREALHHIKDLCSLH